jgi:hypothetical protein
MRKKYVFGLAIAALMTFGCTEPNPLYFEGRISGKSTVKDVFGNGATTYIHVDPTAKPYEGCAPAGVAVTSSTQVTVRDIPPRPGTPADLSPRQLVRVLLPAKPDKACPLDLQATAVWIIEP